MRDFLLVTLWGPLSSWGEIAVGEKRPTGTTPTRSALLGMLAAAMGIERSDSDGLASLSRALSVGARVERPGQLTRDFHTTQVGEGSAMRDLRTRTDELTWCEPSKVTTILSSRDYLCDAIYTAGYWCESDEAALEMADLQRALSRPHWNLSLGRKSCVLGAPMMPALYEAPTFREALEQRRDPHEDPILARLIEEPPSRRRVVWQGQHGGYDVRDERGRRDEPGDRSRWQFGVRDEKRGWHTNDRIEE